MPNSDVYRHPAYYDLGYRWNTAAECDFLEACLKRHGPRTPRRLLDVGCGTGRHLLEMARRGFEVHGIDLSPDMLRHAQSAIDADGLAATVAEGDLCRLALEGRFEAAWCLMDTFRFVLTNAEILTHLRTVAAHLAPGGLYITDFWVPRRWAEIGNEIHQWEQSENGTTVRVLYLQHPESIDPIAQTFEDELVFEVQANGQTQTIRGGRTRTRLLLPQEFLALVEASGVFEPVGTFGAFDLAQPLAPASLSWRMITVLRARDGQEARQA